MKEVVSRTEIRFCEMCKRETKHTVIDEVIRQRGQKIGTLPEEIICLECEDNPGEFGTRIR